MKSLKVRRVNQIPLPEVSGLCWRRSPTSGERELLAVGDDKFQIAIATYGAGGAPLSFRVQDVRKLIPRDEYDDMASSQWEAIASDAAGRVYVMQESPGRVFVFDPALGSLVTVMRMTMPKDSPLRKDWKRDENSRGEGLVLLSNGHFLVLKEKKPTLLIEFGPAGAASSGISFADPTPAGMATPLRFDEAFPLGDGPRSEIVPLEYWELSSSSAEVAEDLSEITVGPDRRLYLLSDISRTLSRFDGTLRGTDTEFSFNETWKLPDRVGKPEGLIIADDFAPLVASDISTLDENLFSLSPLRDPAP